MERALVAILFTVMTIAIVVVWLSVTCYRKNKEIVDNTTILGPALGFTICLIVNAGLALNFRVIGGSMTYCIDYTYDQLQTAFTLWAQVSSYSLLGSAVLGMIIGTLWVC